MIDDDNNNDEGIEDVEESVCVEKNISVDDFACVKVTSEGAACRRKSFLPVFCREFAIKFDQLGLISSG